MGSHAARTIGLWRVRAAASGDMRGVIGPSLCCQPTAQTSLGPLADTAASWFQPVPGLGAEMSFHSDPSQCSINTRAGEVLGV